MVALSALVAVGTPTAAAAAPAAPNIASYNVFMLSRALYPNWGQATRADLIHRTGVLAGQDVVVLQELFDNTAGDRLLSNLSADYPHRTPTVGRTRSGWDATKGSYSDTAAEDGGVAIASRWPITRRVQHVYRDGCGADGMANKGFAYVRLDAPTGPVHVIGTHMQAEDSTCTASPGSVRATQRAEITAFVAAERIPAGEPLYVAGDLNVIKGSAEYPAMLADLKAAAPIFTGHRHSWDCADNSICRDQYGPEYASEHLDYVLTLQGPKLTNETRRVKSPVWTVTSWFTTYSYTDYSDHYPIFAS
ncbi:sphingomyelin phosphodiesterase [Actinosynnema sp. NPDC047251]|uniref:sphingomyelin phosphodiesterase n=1 Tax=Saccharothrix espanaensis TaxID=103731 RepID=UPI0018D29E2D|nr:sphingomyelin phosphodiesterase [Saccharothrix espanaensis]